MLDVRERFIRRQYNGQYPLLPRLLLPAQPPSIPIPKRNEQLMSDQDSISWDELVKLTHATQVERFGWCICEDPEQGQLAEDCPREKATI